MPPSPGGGGSAHMSEAKCETGWGDGLSAKNSDQVDRLSPRPGPYLASVDCGPTLPLQGRVRQPQSNKLGVWLTTAPSIASIFNFVSTPPRAEKPPGLLPAASTRWQGTTIGHGLRPSAWPTSRDSSTPPSRFAMSPYVMVLPGGMVRAMS